jgi:hypothetical protein
MRHSDALNESGIFMTSDVDNGRFVSGIQVGQYMYVCSHK